MFELVTNLPKPLIYSTCNSKHFAGVILNRCEIAGLFVVLCRLNVKVINLLMGDGEYLQNCCTFRVSWNMNVLLLASAYDFVCDIIFI